MSGSRVDFPEKARTKNLTVAVIGLGYVGLPLAVEFARAGVAVRGIDVNGERVQAINRGESHIPDVPSATLAPVVQAGRLVASTAYRDCAAADATVICVPTPFTRMKAPDLSYIEAACTALAPHVGSGQPGGPPVHHVPRHHRGAGAPHPGDARAAGGPRLPPGLLAGADRPGQQAVRRPQHPQGGGRHRRRLHRGRGRPVQPPRPARADPPGVGAPGWRRCASSWRTSSGASTSPW